MTAPTGIYRGTITGVGSRALKPLVTGLTEMVVGNLPYGYGTSPYNYNGIFKNGIVDLLWTDLQPTPGAAIDPDTCPCYMATAPEKAAGHGQGTPLTAQLNTIRARGGLAKLVVIAGYMGPQWVKEIPYLDRTGAQVIRPICGVDYGRTATITTASGSTAVLDAGATYADQGQPIQATLGIPASTFVVPGTVVPGVGYTITQAAGAGFGTGTATIGAGTLPFGSCGPFWAPGVGRSVPWDPAHPHDGFLGAFYDLNVQLARRYENDPVVAEVQCGITNMHQTAEGFLRELKDDVFLSAVYNAGLTQAADHACIQAAFDAQVAAWSQFGQATRHSIGLGPNRYITGPRIDVGCVANGTTTVTDSHCLSTDADPGSSSGPEQMAIVGTGIPDGTYVVSVSAGASFVASNPIPAGTIDISFINFATDTAFAPVLASTLRAAYGVRMLGGFTSFNNPVDLSGTPFRGWIEANLPGWVQTKITLNSEVQAFGFAQVSAPTAFHAVTGGKCKIGYGASLSAEVNLASGTLLADIQAAVNSVIPAGELPVTITGGTHWTATWPTTPMDRAAGLLTITVTATITGTGGPFQPLVQENQAAGTMVALLADAASRGFARVEIHPIDWETNQTAVPPVQMHALPSQLLPYAGSAGAWQSANRYQVSVPKLAGGQQGPMQACTPGDGGDYEIGDTVLVGFLQNGTTGQMVILGRILS